MQNTIIHFFSVALAVAIDPINPKSRHPARVRALAPVQNTVSGHLRIANPLLVLV
jgi:hypothetical protein